MQQGVIVLRFVYRSGKKVNFISKLPEQLRSLARFPVPVAVCLAFTIFFNCQVAGFFKVSGQTEADLIFAVAGAVIAGLAGSLWSGTHKANAMMSGLVPLAASVLAALLLFSQGRVYEQSNVALGGLMLATMVAAHLRRDASIDSFWEFDLQLGIAAAMGLVALIVLCGGLSLLLTSIAYLFNVEIRDTIYGHIWVTGTMMIAPPYAIAMIPTDMDEPFIAGASPDLMEKSVFYVLNFALAPLVLAYALMLHIYAAKLAIFTIMPKTDAEWMVLSFGAVGTTAYMIAYPWRELGYASVRWFMRSWFWLMIVPTVMLTIAVWQRNAEYGVTPDRYCLCLFAIWMAAMVVYLAAARGRIELRAIPASLGMALILSSFGPWGATAVGIRSELSKFHEVLEQENLLVDGRLKLDPPGIYTFGRLVASNDRLTSILKWLDWLDALDRISPVFAGMADDPFQAHITDERLRTVLGMNGRWAIRQAEVANSHPATVETENSIALNFDTGRYDRLVGPLWMNRKGQFSFGSPERDLEYGAVVGGFEVDYSDPVLTAGREPEEFRFKLGPEINRGTRPTNRLFSFRRTRGAIARF